MTEQEWLACTELQFMVEYLQDKASNRKCRLFGCACCRRAWHLLTDERSRRAVEVCEEFADGLADLTALRNAHQQAHDAVEENVDTSQDENWTAFDAVRSNAEVTAYHSADLAADTLRNYVFADQREREERAQLTLLRDIFGNPFQSLSLDHSWLTSTVKKLAETIYLERTFTDVPFLADALQDAGCDNEDILDHFRQPGEHVRGCWALDLVLEKE
jgi:hypothetical protein